MTHMVPCRRHALHHGALYIAWAFGAWAYFAPGCLVERMPEICQLMVCPSATMSLEIQGEMATRPNVTCCHNRGGHNVNVMLHTKMESTDNGNGDDNDRENDNERQT